MAKKKYSKKATTAIARKMRAMSGERKPRKQKIAIALNTARKKGYKVPGKKRK
jgi:hypothetical protein